jgi:hypothetical protein
MHRVRTTGLAVVVLSTALAIGCTGANSPSSPSKPAQATVTVDSVKATGESGTPTTVEPPKGMAGPSVISFPPRNEPNAFFQDLTALYRDYLRRPQSSVTYVDPEGENVWLTEYFRFYLNGCTHAESVYRTLAEITLGGSQPVCGAETPTFPPRNLPNEFQGYLESTYRDVLRRSQTLSYVDSEGANVWLAEYLRYRLSGCTHIVAEDKVFTQIRGGGVQAACQGSTTTTTGTVAPLDTNRETLSVSGSSGYPSRRIRLTWSDSSVDLDLYVTGTACTGDDPFACPWIAASQANYGTSEELTVAVQAGRDYYLWVDNFTNKYASYTLSATQVAGFGSSDDVELRFSGRMSIGPSASKSGPKRIMR